MIPDIDTPTRMRVRAQDPLTSILAAEQSHVFSGSHQKRILAALRGHPKSVDAIGILSGLTVVQVDRRVSELQREGKIAVVLDDLGDDLIVNGYRVWQLVATE